MPETRKTTFGLRILAFLMAVALWGFVGISQHHLKVDLSRPTPSPDSR